MSTEVAGTPTYHATVTFPDDGDARNATTLGAALQDLTDRTAALHDKPSGDTSSIGSGATQNVEGTLEIADGGILGVSAGGRILLRGGAQLNALTGSLITHSDGAEESHASGSEDTYDSGSTLSLAGTVAVTATGVRTEAPGSTVTEGGAYTQTGVRKNYAGGHTCERLIPGYNGAANYSATNADVVIIAPNGIDADRVYTLNNSPTALHGETIQFVSFEVVYQVTFASAADIYSPATLGTLADLQLRDYPGFCQSVTFKYSDGAALHPPAGWYVTAWSRWDA